MFKHLEEVYCPVFSRQLCVVLKPLMSNGLIIIPKKTMKKLQDFDETAFKKMFTEEGIVLQIFKERSSSLECDKQLWTLDDGTINVNQKYSMKVVFKRSQKEVVEKLFDIFLD